MAGVSLPRDCPGPDARLSLCLLCVGIRGEPRSASPRELVEAGRDCAGLAGCVKLLGLSKCLYGMYGGNDGRVILLTPEMHDYIESMTPVFRSC